MNVVNERSNRFDRIFCRRSWSFVNVDCCRSSMSSIIKIAVIFAMFGEDFTEPSTLLLALGITVIVSVVEGGIPNGGYIGEVLAITVYGFPMEQALPAAMIVGTLVDPMATLLNANGDLVSAMMVTRISEGKKWLSETFTV